MTVTAAVSAPVPAEGLPSPPPVLHGFQRSVPALRQLVAALEHVGPGPLAQARDDGARALAELDAALVWMPADVITAYDEGWIVASTEDGGYEILRHPCNIDAMFPDFDSDAQAVAHVHVRALRGSPVHQRAIALTLAPPRAISPSN